MEITITEEGLKDLEIGVWYDLVYNGYTIKIYKDGKFIKEMAVKTEMEGV